MVSGSRHTGSGSEWIHQVKDRPIGTALQVELNNFRGWGRFLPSLDLDRIVQNAEAERATLSGLCQWFLVS